MRESTFAELVASHRRELHVHCYRMLGSFDDAEDVVQDALSRAWRSRHTCHTAPRAWLYRITTNACLAFLAQRDRRPAPTGNPDELTAPAWLQPYPDQLLDQAPAEAAVSRETVELVFLVAIQRLSPRQRAVLILRDVLGWPVGDTAAALDSSEAAVKSALQRARAAMRQQLPRHREAWAPAGSPTRAERAALDRYLAAHRDADPAALAAVLHADVRMAMPPEPGWHAGRDAVVALWSSVMVGPDAWGDWRVRITAANRRPAVAHYLRRPGETAYRAQNLDVLHIEGGAIVRIVGFPARTFSAFGLPSAL